MDIQSCFKSFNLNVFVEGYLEWLNGPKFKSICRGSHLKSILKTLYQIRTTNLERKRLRTLEATDGQASVRHLSTSEMSEKDIEVIISSIPPDAPTDEQLTQFLVQVRYLLKPCIENAPPRSQLTYALVLNSKANVPFELEDTRTTNFERRLRTLEATDGQASVRHLFTSEMSEEDIEVIVSKIPPDAPTEEQLTQFLAQVRYLLKPCLEKMPLHSQLTWAGSLNFSAEVPYELEAEWDLSSNR
ncbi:hypothetical protein V9T40_002045 [Parthenolecanium corni]|uniref:Uncharacterized protein n=1 Tax=Parthenolecanium corni TaxID=536013 RepID=A0AAN9Y418_9HEMI